MLNNIENLADLGRYHRRERPDAAALTVDGEAMSYGELDARVNRVANGLLGVASGPQARIGYLGKNSPAYFEIALASARSRNVIVAVNTRLAPPEVGYILNDAAVEVLFVDRHFYDMIEALAPDLPRLTQVIALDGGHASWPDYASWRDAFPDTDPGIALDDDDDFAQLYTSGTTGHPKGVQLTHGGWMRFAAALIDADFVRYEPGDRVLVCMPVFHVAGANTGLLGLLQGAHCVVTRDIVPADILRVLQDQRIRYAFFVPAVILALVNDPRIGDFDFDHLDAISYGASPIAESLLETAREVFDCGFVQLYGLTENFGGATYLSIEDHDAGGERLRSCGRPYTGCEIRIVDEDGAALPAGEVGEICIRSGWLMKGYWGKDDATAEAIRDGWFHTGDAGYLDDAGYLYIHDRMKDMIISGGENIYPAEVENALFSHPDVADVAVIGVPDERWGEAVKAVVVPAQGDSVDAASIIAWARERIARFKVPRSVDVVAELPRNASGKVLRRELREPYWRGKDRRVS
jgi:fatty-acyl-CoA synthase